MQIPSFAWEMGAGGCTGQELCPIPEAQPGPPVQWLCWAPGASPAPQNPRELGEVVQSAPPLSQAKVIRFYKLLIYLTEDPSWRAQPLSYLWPLQHIN